MKSLLLAIKPSKVAYSRIVNPIKEFFSDSRAGGIILICCTVFSLLLSNLSGTQQFYTSFWNTGVHSGAIHLPETYTLWINDVLMVFFFFLVGMEIKRELTIGELSSVRKSMLPVMGALGGMILPALIFSAFNAKTPFHHGWGIPMATDIAFSLGVLSLLGNKVPVQLKIFLMALAIIDDLGAVLTIAIFYTSKLNMFFLLGAVLSGIGAWLLNYFKVKKLGYYFISGIILWYCLFNSGIHATIAGVIMAFCMPLSQLSKIEHYLQKPVGFIIMPLFALANTAIILPSDFGGIYTSSISFGIIAGLVIGKPLGIFLFTFLSVKLKIATLPAGTNFKQLLGMGMLGGIGFTMSIFTSNLAYNNPAYLVISKVAVISGSLIAAIAGYIYINKFKPLKRSEVELSECFEEDEKYNENGHSFSLKKKTAVA